jgi:hypothetical protein
LVLNKPVSKVVSCWRAETWLLVTGAKGELGHGFRRASATSFRRPARMRSADEASGMVPFIENHETVSEIRSARITNIQIV